MIVFLTIAGGVLEFVGLVLVLLGFRRAVRQMLPGERLSDLVWTETRLGAHRLVDRVLKRKRRLTASGAVIARSDTTGTAQGYTPFPDTALEDPGTFLTTLNHKLSALELEVARTRSEAGRDHKSNADAISQLAGDVDRRFTERDETERQFTRGDLVLQVWGWLLVVLGLFLATLAGTIQAVN